MHTAIEFFAGSGLVRLGLSPDFKSVWANDNCAKKRATYVANHGDENFELADIRNVDGRAIPEADLAWASFPCQDLSLAGNLNGMATGTRSGLFWEWIRILWELREAGKLPPVLVAENVVGFIVSNHGRHFHEAQNALQELGYKAGTVVINASAFVPQSRPRAFIVAVRDGIDLTGLSQPFPTPPFHTSSLIRIAVLLDQPNWVWWSLPLPKDARPSFSDLCELDAPCHSPEKTQELCEMLSPLNRKKLDAVKKLRRLFVGTGYRRTRPDEVGVKVQRLEIRFDGLAGCLRTPNGGSSRQTVIIVHNGGARSRLMTTRECARLMGAPDTYKLPGSYNDAYRAMGDAVAVPVTRWLTRHLLKPLVDRVRNPEPSVNQADEAPWFGIAVDAPALAMGAECDV